MTNNFSSVKSNQSSSKFFLVRIVPRRYVNNSLSDAGGGVYTMTFPYYIDKVTTNGVELTKVSSSPSAGEYSYNEDSQLLSINSTPSASNVIVVHYYIFYTSGRNRVVYEDPEDTGTGLRDWLPRIVSSPSLTNSIKNILNGVLSISVSSITIINNESEFDEYLTVYDSFNFAPIKIWLCLDNTDNIQKIYDSKITEISLSGETVSINLENPLTALLEPAYMGDTADSSYFTLEQISTLDPNHNGRPIPYIIGTASRYQTIPDSAIALTDAQKLDSSTLYMAANINHSNTISTTTNREWGLCRVSSNGFLDFGFTPSNVDNSAGTYTRLDGTASEVDKFRIGDTMVATQGGTYYLRVVKVDRTNNYVYTTKEALISTGVVISGNNCPSIVVTNTSTNYYLMYGRDYTATVDTLSSGNKYLKITLVNNFEATVGLAAFDIGQFVVAYRIRPNMTDGLHGGVVESILTSAGLAVDSTSISTANSALAVNCNFSIPQFDEGDFKNYIDYLQNVLESTLGYITLANDFEFEYKLFSAPSSSTEITDVDILKDSFSVNVDYNDIVNQIIAYNPHWSSSEAQEDSNDTPSLTEESLISKHLHQINRTTRFRHVLESMNSRLPEIINIRSNRFATYNFDTKLINIDDILGDDLKLVRSGILGGDSSKQVKIMEITKGSDKTSIVASELYNLS